MSYKGVPVYLGLILLHFLQLQAPVSFFDVTPIGRIVNRFSSDVFSIDDALPFIMNIFLAQIYGIFGTIVITCYGLPWFAILLVPIGILYYKIQVSTWRECDIPSLP